MSVRWQKMALLVLLKGRLVGGAKPNVPFVRWQFKIFCAVGKKLKHRGVGNECRLTCCPFVISFLCLWSLVKMVYFFLVFSRLFVVVGSSFTLAANGSPDLRGFGAGVAKLRSAEKSRKCADVSRSRPHLRMQSGDPMWRRMAPHFPYIRNIPVSTFRIFSRLAFEKGLCKLEDKEVHIPGFQGSPTGGGLEVGTPRVVPVF